MGSRGRPLFDLNETPMDDDEEINGSSSFQPKKTLPSLNSCCSDLFAASAGVPSIANNNAFSHASSVSGFQPFIRSKVSPSLEKREDENKSGRGNSDAPTSSKIINDNEKRIATLPKASSMNDHIVEREEGEWSDGECSGDAYGIVGIREGPNVGCNKASQERDVASMVDQLGYHVLVEKVPSSASTSEVSKNENSNFSAGLERDSSCIEGSASRNSERNLEGNIGSDQPKDLVSVQRQKEIKGVEASYAMKCANNLGKKHKLDEHKEAMLGKKRSRQTMFLNLEDVKQAGAVRSSVPKKQTVPITVNRAVRGSRNASSPADRNGEKVNESSFRDQHQVDASCDEHCSQEINDRKSECNNDMNAGALAKPRRLNSSSDLCAELNPQPIPRQNSWKPTDSRQLKNSQASLRKPVSVGHGSIDPKSGSNKKNPPKKQIAVSSQYQDTSVERLLREVTGEKFWNNAEETDLQCVPGQFDSVEEYVRVFEPLLFEECRAQLHNTWEELTETPSRDMHIMVRVRSVERRERGWYDVIVLPVHEIKWTFKEGDVAVLSSPRPGSVRSRRSINCTEDHDELEVAGRVVGTVRRHVPIDTRDPHGAILHFFVGDAYDPNSNVNNDHILKKLQPRGTWFLTVLGSFATTQREYVGLHAFRRLNSQMQGAILQPGSEHFPKYQEQTPAMPECFTPNFVDHLHRSFNGPQLAAIKWAATHTAAGTAYGITRRQDPWPFTLVQGPPGTGKTHTVWGMLNVIHLVQYQHYYTALLKKLAPESYKQTNESSTDGAALGSIDEVLQSMDLNLFRTLPKLCPKPRMLVCAPSNAATDELLARVLDRGFIDGEMKVYRPDVARVGVDSQSRAAQAVSVERRTEQLLGKSREEICGWLHNLKQLQGRLAQEIQSYQKQLNVTAAAGRSQGSVGVDPEVLVARDMNRDTLLQNLARAVEQRDKALVEISRLVILERRFFPGTGFNLEEARASLEASFANEAEVVFTTLSSSGRKLFSRLTHGFDVVVIDEAAQASEVAVLPPLSLGAGRCVLVGDPQQLPATVISKAAGTLLYSRSLFERFQQAGCPTMLLSVQYRMHPQIRDFPSRYFYQGRLSDSETVLKLPDERYYQDPLLRPYLFYDITHGRESHRGGSVSYQNINEAQFCLRLYEHLHKIIKSSGLCKVSVGIITPYKLQLKCLQREFEEVLNSEQGKDLCINTIDAFQGQERDVIIMSCVRASNHGVGFVADVRRMNVALTRARRALWVMGNANALAQCDDWAALIADAKARSCYMDMESLPKDFLIPRGPPYASFPGKFPAGSRGMRSSGPRSRYIDMPMDSRGAPSTEDRSNSFDTSRMNENQRSFKPQMENSLDDFDRSGDRSRDVWQHGIQKRQNSNGPLVRKES